MSVEEFNGWAAYVVLLDKKRKKTQRPGKRR